MRKSIRWFIAVATLITACYTVPLAQGAYALFTRHLPTVGKAMERAHTEPLQIPAQ